MAINIHLKHNFNLINCYELHHFSPENSFTLLLDRPFDRALSRARAARRKRKKKQEKKSKMAFSNIAEVWKLYIKIRSNGRSAPRLFYYAILWNERLHRKTKKNNETLPALLGASRKRSEKFSQSSRTLSHVSMFEIKRNFFFFLLLVLSKVDDGRRRRKKRS